MDIRPDDIHTHSPSFIQNFIPTWPSFSRNCRGIYLEFDKRDLSARRLIIVTETQSGSSLPKLVTIVNAMTRSPFVSQHRLQTLSDAFDLWKKVVAIVVYLAFQPSAIFNGPHLNVNGITSKVQFVAVA